MNHNIIMNNINLQFNDGVIISLYTSSFLFKYSNLFKNIDTNEDMPILCPSSYVLDDSNVFYFNDKNDLSFMFTLNANKFIDICKFLDIICYENIDKLFSKQFIEYVMKNIKKEIYIIQYFMQPEIRSIINYINNASNNLSHENEIMCCTPEFYFLYLIKYKESVIKYNRIDIYELVFNKNKYYRYIHKYDNRLTYNVKETHEYKDYVINISNNLLLECNKENNIIEIKDLIELGADVNFKNSFYETALHYASKIPNNIEVIQYLLEHGADINILNYFNNTALHIASSLFNNIEVIKELIKYSKIPGEYINLYNSIHQSAIFIASKIPNNLEVIQYFIEHGANILALRFNDTILHIACNQPNNIKVIKYLVEYIQSSDTYKYNFSDYINLVTYYSCTALHFASEIPNNLEVIQYLVEQGADINIQGTFDYTALHYAARLPNNLDVVQYLVEHGADINILTNCGETASQIAQQKYNIEVIKYLQKIST